MSSKLNWLLSNIAPGNLALQSWLSAHGISPQLTWKYTQSNWLTKLRTGVYVRPGRSPQWQDAVHCLIEQSNIPVRIAGLTSLNLQGKSQYLTILEPSIWLALPPDTSLPIWFREFSHDANNNAENKNPQWEAIKTGKITSIAENDIIEIQTDGLILPASKQELAIVEIGVY